MTWQQDAREAAEGLSARGLSGGHIAAALDGSIQHANADLLVSQWRQVQDADERRASSFAVLNRAAKEEDADAPNEDDLAVLAEAVVRIETQYPDLHQEWQELEAAHQDAALRAEIMGEEKPRRSPRIRELTRARGQLADARASLRAAAARPLLEAAEEDVAKAVRALYLLAGKGTPSIHFSHRATVHGRPRLIVDLPDPTTGHSSSSTAIDDAVDAALGAAREAAAN